MRKTLVITAILIACLAFGGWLTYRFWLAPPSAEPRPDTETTPDAATGIEKECRLACNRLEICRHPLAGPDCPAYCAKNWEKNQVTCIERAACDEVNNICLFAAGDTDCADACDKALQCGLVQNAEGCLAECWQEWSEDLRACLVATSCDEVEAVCLPAIDAGSCGIFCERLNECALVDFIDDADCLDYCLTLDDTTLRQCVLQTSCELIEPVCLSEDFNPECLSACTRLERCGALGDIPADTCPAVCLAEWDEETIACLLESACEAIGPECLGRPDPVCVEICGKLTECQMEADIADCSVVCSTSLDDETRQCILDAACEEIDSVCFTTPPDLCDLACTKAVSCQLDEDYAACYESCQTGFEVELIGCILAFPCEKIGENCLH
ncbi:MAG: hypothetical protein GX444_13335 [Myxococcales bacterium]|nr:hypothetical protein [Myxococcales bacterium]